MAAVSTLVLSMRIAAAVPLVHPPAQAAYHSLAASGRCSGRALRSPDERSAIRGLSNYLQARRRVAPYREMLGTPTLLTMRPREAETQHWQSAKCRVSQGLDPTYWFGSRLITALA